MPFPYVERAVLELRPVLIVGREMVASTSPLHYAVMITSAANRGWPDDISLEDDFEVCGLPRPSLIRMAKIASITAGDAALIGRLTATKLALVEAALRATVTPPA